MDTESTDEKLLTMIQTRQENALSELYDRYNRLVFSLALNSLGNTGDAEEVVQDVFLRIWERSETYHPEQGKVVSWLVRIAHNRAIDLIRSRSVRVESNSVAWEELTIEPAGQQNVERAVELRQKQQRVRLAINQLPAEQKEVLALAYFQGLTQQQIADRLGQPLGTVKTRIRSAMQKLNKLLNDI